MITELIMIPVGQRCDDPWGRKSEGVLVGQGRGERGGEGGGVKGRMKGRGMRE